MPPKKEAPKSPPVLKPQSAEDWAFVNLSEPNQSKDKDLRQFVRSNAMRDYRQRKKQGEVSNQSRPGGTAAGPSVLPLSPSSGPSMSYPAQSSGGGDRIKYCGHAECAYECRYSPRRVQPSPTQLVGGGASDPFNAVPFEGDSRYNSYVLNHFDAVIARNFLPVETGGGRHPLTAVWMPHAVADPLLFLATLNFAAAHLDVMHGRQCSPRTIAQKVETIRLINLRIQESNGTLSNTTIGAVAMLAAMESTTGNNQELNFHMDALEKMVRMRGGLQRLGWDGVLQMFIAWQDLVSSAMLSAPPHFPKPPDLLIVQGEMSPSIPICPDLGASIVFCAEMINNYNDMRHLTDLLSQNDKPTSRVEQTILDSEGESLEHRFLSANFRKPKDRMIALDYLLETGRIAALIFLNRIFHGPWPHSQLIRELMSLLKELLLEKDSHIIIDVPLQEQWGYYAWILFIGGIHSQTEEDTAFFAKRIAIATRVWQAKGFSSWQDILHLIQRVAWTNSLQGPECDALGRQVDRTIGKTLAPDNWAHTCSPAAFNTLLTAWSSAAKFNVVCCTSAPDQRPHLLPLLMSRLPLSGEV